MPTKINVNRLFDRILETYGLEHQLRKMQEECGELIAAIQHYQDGREGSLEELQGEVADVLFVANQIRKGIGPKAVDTIFNEKARKMSNRVIALQCYHKKKEQTA